MALLVNLKKLLNAKNGEGEKDGKFRGAAAPGEARGGNGGAKKSDDSKGEKLDTLTSREGQLLALLLEGMTLRQAADSMSIKYPTANTHINSIYKKLGVSSRAELIIKYRGNNG